MSDSTCHPFLDFLVYFNLWCCMDTNLKVQMIFFMLTKIKHTFFSVFKLSLFFFGLVFKSLKYIATKEARISGVSELVHEQAYVDGGGGRIVSLFLTRSVDVVSNSSTVSRVAES